MNFTRESIFISALRVFFNTLAFIIGICIAIFLLVLGISAISDTITTPDKSHMTLSSDANWNRKLLAHTTPVIARIDIDGVIGGFDLKTKKFKDMLLDSRSGALASDRVKGILLYVNTPGGTATDSTAIYHLLKTYKEKFKVPIFAYIEGMCASGGMYITAAADQVFATADSMIGSIGVRMGPTFNFSDAMTKVGIQSLTLTEGLNKDALNPFRPWKEGEDANLKDVIKENYDQFVDTVVTARKGIDKEKLLAEYGANVFAAPKAQEIGFIDHSNAEYDETLKALVKAAGIKDDEAYQVVQIEPYQSVFKSITENKMALLEGKLKHVFPTGPNTTSEMSGQILYLYQP